MGKFKRYDGYVMHVPQEFIDSKLPVCPFCKSDNPHWLLDSRMEMSLAGSRTYYSVSAAKQSFLPLLPMPAQRRARASASTPAWLH